MTGKYWSDFPRADRLIHKHVTIVGAGIIGLTTAAALVRSGRSVTVIDSATSVGMATSFGNGCQLSYGYVAPLAQPGLIAELPKLLFSKGSPLRIVPRMDPEQWAWMLKFLRACSKSIAQRNSLELLTLGQLSHQETDMWLEGADAESLSFTRSGKLVVLPSAESLAKAKAQVELQSGLGPLQRAVTEEETLAIEPALATFRGRMAGSIFTDSECAVDSYALCKHLELQLRARGVRFELGKKVQGFKLTDNRVSHLVTDQGIHDVDGLVLATGPGSSALAGKLGFTVPVYPLKGYSITAAILDPTRVPKVSVTDSSKKVVYARIGSRLRIAGVAEIRGYDSSIDARRISELVGHTRAAFGDAVDLSSVSAWTGLRPATPTSVPIIGVSPVRNVFLNVGHGALGLTLAFGSAKRLVDAIAAPH